MTTLSQLKKELHDLGDPSRAKILQRFFKTGKGEYGEGDVFLGLTSPQLRVLARKYSDLAFADIKKLLLSKIHEERVVALCILVGQFHKEGERKKDAIYRFYLKHASYVNNWDLVDMSADKIVGAYLLKRNKNILKKLARSNHLWERRIAVIATFEFIKHNDLKETIIIAKILFKDSHDLIQKAVGWMLREVGKRSLAVEEQFLKKYYKKMPRTMLRYAIERFPEKKRRSYLKGNV